MSELACVLGVYIGVCLLERRLHRELCRSDLGRTLCREWMAWPKVRGAGGSGDAE